MSDVEPKPEKPAEHPLSPKEDTPFSVPPLQETGKSIDPPEVERRDG